MPQHDAVIVGAGMSGLCMAVRLLQAGRSVVILEKSDQLGGTWAANRYPGCACDIPSHLYGFSFALNPQWSRVWAGQPEILAYLHDVADRFGLWPHIRLGVAAERAEYDAATASWAVQTAQGVFRGQYLIGATGPLRVPRMPDIPGVKAFQGDAMHTARWDASVGLAGRRVAVIGAAASAIQMVPHLAREVGQLVLFQRTPNYVLPRHNRRYSRAERWAMARLPGYNRAVRWWLYCAYEQRFFLAFTPDRPTARVAEALARRRIAAAVSDPVLRKKVMPSYRLGCKRVLLDGDYYRSLQQDNVTVVTDPITHIDAEGVVTSGERFDVDAIIYATGFDVWSPDWARRVVGRGGQSLEDAFGDAPAAWLGMAVPEFPNYFALLGPNTGLGHNSVVWMVERQVEHLVRLFRAAEHAGMRSLEVRPAVMHRYVDDLHRRMQKRVWVQGGCASWYQHPDGRIRTLWPDSTLAWWWTLRRVSLQDYQEDAPH